MSGIQQPFEPGDTLLGKYQITGVLGTGGMGTVYAADDLRLGRSVAIKVLRSDDPSLALRFRREARAIAQVTHPNLVVLLDVDVLQDGQPALIMEQIKGETLKVVMQDKTIALGQIFRMLRQVLNALTVCHAHGIIHRDLKPENIMVDRSGPEWICTVIDFGLTKLLANQHSVLTLQGQVFGSPRFMAPEQWMRQPVDGRTDQYAVALIGFCLINGRHFIPASHPLEMYNHHLDAERPPLLQTRLGETIPTRMADTLHRAASPHIDDRFESCRAMLLALEGAPSTRVVSSPRIAMAETVDLPKVVLATPFNPAVLQADADLFDDPTTIENRFATPMHLIDEGARTLVDSVGLSNAVNAAAHQPITAELVSPEPSPVHVVRIAQAEIEMIRQSQFDLVRRATEENPQEPAPDETLNSPKRWPIVLAITVGLLAWILLR